MLEIYKFTSMTSPCEVQIYSNDKIKADQCANEILNECKRLEDKYNFYDNTSYLTTLNNRDEYVLDSETKSLIQRAKQYYKKTNGLFDVTLSTYRGAKEYKDLESYNKMKDELSVYIGCNHFEIKKNKLYFDNKYTKIDLGGFVKEYSVDQAVKIIKKYKISSALINFGGDIYAHGLKPNKSKFQIAITNPVNNTENLLSVEIQDEALTTSASYERNTSIENKIFSHILNISTSRNILSATVIAKSCVEAGVYSTSLMSDEVSCVHKKYLINNDLNIIN